MHILGNGGFFARSSVWISVFRDLKFLFPRKRDRLVKTPDPAFSYRAWFHDRAHIVSVFYHRGNNTPFPHQMKQWPEPIPDVAAHEAPLQPLMTRWQQDE